jgi:hypothetical protein
MLMVLKREIIMKNLAEYFFVSDCDGALHDTRVDDWSSKPIRANYKRHHRTIETVADLKATLRAGSFAWPGGYPLFFITSDGAALSFYTARTQFRHIADSIATGSNDGWRIVACEINYEDSDLQCDHTGNRIASAYGDD